MRKPVPVCICSDAVLVRSFKLHYGTLCYSFIPGSEIVVDFQGHRRVSKIMKVIFICFECEPTEQFTLCILFDNVDMEWIELGDHMLMFCAPFLMPVEIVMTLPCYTMNTVVHFSPSLFVLFFESAEIHWL